MKPVENTLAVSIFVVLTKRKGCRLVKFSWRLSNLWRLCLRYLLRCLSLQRNFNCTISHSNIFNWMCKVSRVKAFLFLRRSIVFSFLFKKRRRQVESLFLFHTNRIRGIAWRLYPLMSPWTRGKFFFCFFFFTNTLKISFVSKHLFF